MKNGGRCYKRMSLNRNDLIKQMNEASGELLREKGYVCFVDILLRIGKLTNENHEAWLSRKVPYLEKVIQVNLMEVNYMLRERNKRRSTGQYDCLYVLRERPKNTFEIQQVRRPQHRRSLLDTL